MEGRRSGVSTRAQTRSHAGGEEGGGGGGRVTTRSRGSARGTAGVTTSHATKRAPPGGGGESKLGGGNQKKRAALSDITNARCAPGAEELSADIMQLEEEEKKRGEGGGGGGGGVVFTRSMAATLSRPISHVEATLVLERASTAIATTTTSSLSLPLSPPPPPAPPAPPSSSLPPPPPLSSSSPRLLPNGAVNAEINLPPSTGDGAMRVWEDVDEKYHDDPQMCTAYVNSIHDYLREAQTRHRPQSNYMGSIQTDINPTMRGILVDWLVEVAEEYKLLSDTLYLSVNYIDRVLSSQSVVRSKLQLVGITCMLIAAKYEEIHPPQVEEFCYITDNTYNRTDVVAMERTILDKLSFELTVPTSKTFLRRYLHAANAETRVEYLASFLTELTLLDYSFLVYEPSMVAASSVFLALLTLQRTHWTPTLVFYTRYQPAEMKECVKSLHTLHCQVSTGNLPAVREKYGCQKFRHVSTIAPLTSLPCWAWEDMYEV